MKKNRRFTSLLNLLLTVAAYIVIKLVLAAMGGNRAITNLLTQVCYNIIMVASLNLVAGVLGELTLGHAGFMAVGAYCSAIFTSLILPNQAWTFPLALIVGGLVATIFSQETGFINAIIKSITGKPYPFLYREGSWMAIFIGSGIWKGMGYGTIIYMAALTAIDPTFYEAAVLDGANKAQQIWYVTLPCIRSTIVTLFILQTGSVMEVGFDQVYALMNNVVSNVADVISTYVYRMGIQGARFSPATAMGLFDSLVGLVLVLISNRIAKAFGESLW